MDKKVFITLAPGVAFTALFFLLTNYLLIGTVSESVCHWQAFPVECYVTL
jgi:hypothetical protein